MQPNKKKSQKTFKWPKSKERCGRRKRQEKEAIARVDRSHKRDGQPSFWRRLPQSPKPRSRRTVGSEIERVNLRLARDGFPIRLTDFDFHNTVKRRSRNFAFIFGRSKFSLDSESHPEQRHNHTRRCTRYITLTRSFTRVSCAFSYALSCFSRSVEGISRLTARENPRSWPPPPLIPGAGGCKDKEAKKKQPTARGGDKRETTGETAPSLSDFERRKKEDRIR